MAVDHYENFPVASWLMPARLRPAVRAVYAFARSADDFADAGDWPAERRLASLAAYQAELDAIAAGRSPSTPILHRLADVIRTHDLPLQPFRDLLDAFRQDVEVSSYADHAAVLDYCRRSANPVGRIMLGLWDCGTPELLRASDAICTALQLVNFLQDVAVDAAIPRVYLPRALLADYGLTLADVQILRVAGPHPLPPALGALVLAECKRVRALMLSGADLPRALGGRIGLELGLVVAGGLRVLERIEAVSGDVVHRRPELGRADWPRMAWRAWVSGFPPAPASC
jgi:squalene synthase HpnC